MNRRISFDRDKTLSPVVDHTPNPSNRSTQISGPPKLITVRELREIVPFTRQHILRLEKRGRFPRRIQLSTNRVAWLMSEVEAWIADRIAERDLYRR
ncbi:MAG: AlpA family phage regulatory protein [Hyphomicrobiaceae bacterium]|nr:MAG: AlpA family phage regulatory protein [Hyphomicrobiaceae bacterium]